MRSHPAIRFLFRWPAAIPAVLATALIVVAAAQAELPRVAIVAEDQAAAKSVVLKKGDLGSPAWKGGAKKPDLTTDATCPDFNPKEADLTITGAAETDFKSPGLDIDSEVDVYQTAEMVRVHWPRVAASPGFVSCIRSIVAKGMPAGQKLVSLARIPFPRVVPHTTAVRAIIEVTSGGNKVRVWFDAIFISRGRSEISLTFTGRAGFESALRPLEIQLARLLASRAVM